MFKKCSFLLRKRVITCGTASLSKKTYSTDTELQFDLNYLCNPANIQEIEHNIAIRKRVGNIKLVNELRDKLTKLEQNDSNYNKTIDQLRLELTKLPNKTHPDVLTYNEQPHLVKLVGKKPSFSTEPHDFHEITKRLNLVRTEQLGNVCGSKSYYIMGELAQMEQALIRYGVKNLLKHNYELVSVPDILPRSIIEKCGQNTKGTRNQVYSLDPQLHEPDLCLSGTSEMALAGLFMDRTLNEEELPLKLAAVSRCYRAETSSIAEERGIYRVHEFTKVEMFVVSTPDQSDALLEEIREQQENHFASLNLHFQVLDMPPHELGAPAYRKYDIEAWMPGRKMYGEISSCSNCTDYQSRRLNIRYKTKGGEEKYPHTLNGTASAIPRLLIALVENGQSKNGTIQIPEALHLYLNNKTVIGKQKGIPPLKLIKNKK